MPDRVPPEEPARERADIARAHSQDEREQADSRRADAETARTVEQGDRSVAEGTRLVAEQARQAAEVAREIAEVARSETGELRRSHAAQLEMIEGLRRAVGDLQTRLGDVELVGGVADVVGFDGAGNVNLLV